MSKMSQNVPKNFEYDLIVIGSNPGGVACAREAGLAGKKTAILKCVHLSPAESEGVDENLEEMEAALKGEDWNLEEMSGQTFSDPNSFDSQSGSSYQKISFKNLKKSSESLPSARKVRKSRLDLNNEFFKRGEECRRLMHNAVLLGDLVDNAYKSGWRLTTTRPPLTMNWTKMSEEIMDFVMEENWKLATELSEQGVEVMEGEISFEDNHTVLLTLPDMTYRKFTTDLICLAPLSECILPEDVVGAESYGITSDDFLRLAKPPKSTLVVGGLPESLECAGIVAGSRFPVTVVTRSKVLKNCDSEITEMIINSLREKGVKFLEETNLRSIEVTSNKTFLASFELFSTAEEESREDEEEGSQSHTEVFDTVIFAVGRKVNLNNLDLTPLGLDVNLSSSKVLVSLPTSETAVPNIYAVGGLVEDCPDGTEISQLAGKLLGRRLFHNYTECMDYGLIPAVIYTPVEYAFVGLSEDVAINRLGDHCIQVYYGYFKPLEFVLPQKREAKCFAKVVVLLGNELIIGLHFYGPQAGEIIQGFSAAVRTGMSLKDFRTLVGLAGTNAQEILKVKELRMKKPVKEEEEENAL